METTLEASETGPDMEPLQADSRLRLVSYALSFFWLMVLAWYLFGARGDIFNFRSSTFSFEIWYDAFKELLFILWLLVSCLLSGRHIKVGYIGLGVACFFALFIIYLVFTFWMITIIDPLSFLLLLPVCMCIFSIAILHFYLLVKVL